MTRETGIQVCGLCHGHYGYAEVARVIGIDPQEVTWQAPGLNHLIWLTHFYYRGKDAYPLIDEWIEIKGPEYWDTHIATGTHDISTMVRQSILIRRPPFSRRWAVGSTRGQRAPLRARAVPATWFFEHR